MIEKIYRHLRTRRICQHEALRLDRRKAAGRFADLLGDPLRQLQIRGVELDVERDEERPGSDDDRARGLVEPSRSRIRYVGRLEELGETLELRPTDVRQAHAVRLRRGARVVVHGNVVSRRHLAPEAVGERDALVHRHAREWDERHDVDRAEPRVFALVRHHVDLAVREVDEGVRRAGNSVGLARVCEDRAVVVDITRAVEKTNALGRADGVGEAIDDVAAPSFAHIRDAFDKLWHRARG